MQKYFFAGNFAYKMTKLEQSDGATINQNIPGPTDLNYLRFAKSSFANKKIPNLHPLHYLNDPPPGLQVLPEEVRRPKVRSPNVVNGHGGVEFVK